MMKSYYQRIIFLGVVILVTTTNMVWGTSSAGRQRQRQQRQRQQLDSAKSQWQGGGERQPPVISRRNKQDKKPEPPPPPPEPSPTPNHHPPPTTLSVPQPTTTTTTTNPNNSASSSSSSSTQPLPSPSLMSPTMTSSTPPPVPAPPPVLPAPIQTSKPTLSPLAAQVVVATTPSLPPPDPACEAADNGIEFSTEYAIYVTYYYEILTRTDVLLFDAAEYVDEMVRDHLVKKLVNCKKDDDEDQDDSSSSSTSPPIQGISKADADTYAGVDCSGILSYDGISEICYVVKGTIIVYLLSSDSLTELQVQDQVWMTLEKEFNGKNRRELDQRELEERQLKKSKLINKEKGILALYFLGVSSSESTFDTSGGAAASAAMAAARKKKRGKRRGWAATMVGLIFFLLVLLGFAILQQRKDEKEEEEMANGYHDDDKYKVNQNQTMISDDFTDPDSPELVDHRRPRRRLTADSGGGNGGGMAPSETSLDDEPSSRNNTNASRGLRYGGEEEEEHLEYPSFEASYSTGPSSHCYTYDDGKNSYDDEAYGDTYDYSTAGMTLVSSGMPDTDNILSISLVEGGGSNRQDTSMVSEQQSKRSPNIATDYADAERRSISASSHRRMRVSTPHHERSLVSDQSRRSNSPEFIDYAAERRSFLSASNRRGDHHATIATDRTAMVGVSTPHHERSVVSDKSRKSSSPQFIDYAERRSVSSSAASNNRRVGSIEKRQVGSLAFGSEKSKSSEFSDYSEQRRARFVSTSNQSGRVHGTEDPNRMLRVWAGSSNSPPSSAGMAPTRIYSDGDTIIL